MFQLFDLIITSPIGVFAMGVIQDVIFAALLLTDCEECAFNDLGKLLLGGVAAAIVVGIAISLLIRRKKDNTNSDFVSIRSGNRED